MTLDSVLPREPSTPQPLAGALWVSEDSCPKVPACSAFEAPACTRRNIHMGKHTEAARGTQDTGAYTGTPHPLDTHMGIQNKNPPVSQKHACVISVHPEYLLTGPHDGTYR